MQLVIVINNLLASILKGARKKIAKRLKGVTCSLEKTEIKCDLLPYLPEASELYGTGFVASYIEMMHHAYFKNGQRQIQLGNVIPFTGGDLTLLNPEQPLGFDPANVMSARFYFTEEDQAKVDAKQAEIDKHFESDEGQEFVTGKSIAALESALTRLKDTKVKFSTSGAMTGTITYGVDGSDPSVAELAKEGGRQLENVFGTEAEAVAEPAEA
jgi:hypothetical protein